MNQFDLSIQLYLNQFAHHCLILDQLVMFIQNEAPLSGGIVMALFWWAWGRSNNPGTDARIHLVFGLVASVFSILVARVLAVALPFRERPLHNPLIHFQLPYGMEMSALIGWSSFPSDHATFFFCLAAVLWMISRRLGALATLVAIFVVSLPRVYTGVHYPTDLIAGAILGCAIALVSRYISSKSRVARPVLRWMNTYPAPFYACLFVCTFEVGELFTTAQDLAHPIGHVLAVTLQALR